MRIATALAASVLLLVPPASASPEYFEDCVSLTGQNATVVLMETAPPLVADNPLQPGDEIAVFTPDGLCAGAAVWNGTSLAMAIWGDDSGTPDVDGFLPGQPLAFLAYHNGHLYGTDAGTVEFTFSDLFDDGDYDPDGIYVVESLQFTVVSEPPGGSEHEFQLEPAFPNPLFSHTTLRYSLAEESDVQLSVFDVLGRRVATLVHETQEAGAYEAVFDVGPSLAAGLYIVRLQAGSQQTVRRITLVR